MPKLDVTKLDKGRKRGVVPLLDDATLIEAFKAIDSGYSCASVCRHLKVHEPYISRVYKGWRLAKNGANK